MKSNVYLKCLFFLGLGVAVFIIQDCSDKNPKLYPNLRILYQGREEILELPNNPIR
jgi:hypothetical protein